MEAHGWPGDPETVWAAVDRSSPGAPARPALPEWRSPAGFRAHVLIAPDHVVLAIALALMGVLLAVCGWIASRGVDTGRASVMVDLIGAGMALCGLALLIGAVVILVRGHRTWDRHVERLHRRVVQAGIPVHTYPSPLRVHEGDGSAPTALLIDARLSDRAAARVHAGGVTWLERITADRKTHHQAMDRFTSSRHVLPLEEVLGPQAAGAWVARHHRHGMPWGLLLPDDSASDGFGLRSVLVIHPAETDQARVSD